MRTFAALWMLGAALSGCGGGTTVHATVIHPAEVPVRSFPRIWIAGGHMDHEIRLIEALSEHLRGAEADVRRVELDHLEPMRRAGRIPAATVVLILELSLQERTRPEWGSRPETVCGPMGCYSTSRSYVYEVPIVTGALTVTAYDGPTARVQDRVTLRAEAARRDWDVLRGIIVRDLEGRLKAAVDQREERVEVKLLHLDSPQVERAIERIRRGDWTGGRRILEEVWESGTARALDREAQARLLYDIGQARRFDPSTLGHPEEHFAAAERALRAAVERDRKELYARALRAVEAHRREYLEVREQRLAAEHNYRLGRSGATPAPPPSYGTQPPPPE